MARCRPLFTQPRCEARERFASLGRGIYIDPAMTNQPRCRFVPSSDIEELIGLSITTLRKLRTEQRLIPGVHWAYLNGTEMGPVGWDPIAIAEWQAEQTKAVCKQSRAARIETLSKGDK